MFDKRVKIGRGYMKPMEAMILVKKSQFAFYSEEPTIYRIADYTFTNEEICSLQEVEVEKPLKMHIPLRRNSPLMKYVNCG